MKSCNFCNKALKKGQAKYCSNACQLDFQYMDYIRRWQSGEVDGGRGINARNLSGHVIFYLIKKFGQQCSRCGWDEKNPVTKRVPLEIDHIDGNADNNSEENLRLICPNCHALTVNFRNLNKGSGRLWRKNKYIKSA